MSKEANSTERALKLALEALENNRRTHYYCEDTWYSCPKHEEGCANESEGDECNCGADKANVEIDGAITALREALAQQALDKKAENARELGLMPYNGGDYEPAKDNSNYRFDPPGLDPSHQKPVAWWIPKAKQFCLPSSDGTRPFAKAWEPLYTSPPQRKPLTDEKIAKEFYKFEAAGAWYQFARAIEAAHGIKENT